MSRDRLERSLQPVTALPGDPDLRPGQRRVDLRGALGDALGQRLTWAVITSLILGKIIRTGWMT
jgi:Na+:H+ antiporter, NhaA family